MHTRLRLDIVVGGNHLEDQGVHGILILKSDIMEVEWVDEDWFNLTGVSDRG